MKKCTKCGHTGKFNKDKRNKDGLKSWCQSCTKEAKKKWASKNKGYVKKKKKEWDDKNKTYVLSAAKAFSLKWRYGITPEDYQRMMNEQGGVCKICGEPPKGRFMLSVDHNHTTNKVRGLLCGKCNFALGNTKDNPVLLRKAADYLESNA